MLFSELPLANPLQRAVRAVGYETPTPIQERSIPSLLEGRDLLGIAQTGTGKTAAFALPILQRLLDSGKFRAPKTCRALILLPTRELAIQVEECFKQYAQFTAISTACIFGGVNDASQKRNLVRGVDVLVATPGRLLDLIGQKAVSLKALEFFVLDEADRMLDMGFSEDILTIVKELPDSCQRVMFSATMPSKIRELAVSLLHDPVEVKLAVSKPAEKIQQSAYVCYDPQKLGIIEHLFKAGDLQRVIVFSGKKDRVKDITRQLKRMNINCAEMHSDLSQQERDDVMYRFKAGQVDVLVATDIVSRGIDIDDIRIVINYDVPHDAEDYVHRIGRTARADRDGVAITFVSEAEIYKFQEIEHFLGKEVEKRPLPENLGEGPAYTKREKKRSDTRRHGRWNSRGNGQHNNRHGKKSKANKQKNSQSERKTPKK